MVYGVPDPCCQVHLEVLREGAVAGRVAHRFLVRGAVRKADWVRLLQDLQSGAAGA